MKYLPNEARREAEEAILAAQAAAQEHKTTALEALKMKTATQRKAEEVEREAALKVEDAEVNLHCSTIQYEDRLRDLEELLEAERAAHEKTQREFDEKLQEVHDECDAAIKQERARAAELISAANVRAIEAENLAEEVRKRSAEAVDKARASEEARVKEARKVADERIRKNEEQKRQEIEAMRREVATIQKQCAEKIGMNVSQKNAAIEEAKRHMNVAEKDLDIWRSAKEVQLAKKEADTEEWVEAQRRQRMAFEDHATKLLGIEQYLHKHTMARTLDKVTLHLHGGEKGGGADSYVGELMATRPAPAPLMDMATYLDEQLAMQANA